MRKSRGNIVWANKEKTVAKFVYDKKGKFEVAFIDLKDK